ncbi:TPA: hypothetical protein NJT28_000090 [Corynebacterium striatum]|nr:hypothetical protein [Corynebacterium striatum]
MNISRRILPVTAALALTMGGLVPAQAQVQLPPQAQELSSQLPAGSSQIELPEQAYDLAKQFNIQLPPFIKQPAPEVAHQLVGATNAHLRKQGHVEDGNARNIAQEWADQGAAGTLTFHGNAGDGRTHLNEGSGNVYRLSIQEAQDRLNWLNRDVPVTPGPSKHFGVATSFDGTNVYVAEYFFN